MGTIVTAVVSVYFFIISYKLRFAYFFFVFLIPFLPKYIGFGVGGEGFALSLNRILIMILFISTMILFTQNSKHISIRISCVYRKNKTLINLLLLFFALKVVSLSLNSRELSLYIMLFNDFLFSIFIFLLTIILIDSEEMIQRLAKIFFYSYTFVLLLVLIDSVLQYSLYGLLASNQMNLNKDYVEGLERGGRFRTQASFLSSILLGEYLVMLFPIVVAYINKNNYSLIVKASYFFIVVYAIYSTGSRSAILMSVALVYFYLILILYKKNTFSRFFANLFNIIVIVLVVFFVFNYINYHIANFSGRYDKISDEGERSSTSRALQYIAVYEKIREAPLFGFGRERNFLTTFKDIDSLDNYYFWTILEVGSIGLVAYILFLYSLVRAALHQNKLAPHSYYLLPITLGTIINILYQFFIAVPDNQIYLFIFTGLIITIKVLQKK